MIPKQQTAHHIVNTISLELLAKYGDKDLCNQYAWWVLESITQQNKAALLLKDTITLSEQQQQKLTQWIKQQVHGNIPLQYLIGTVPFADCSFLVEPPILIPRQETEEWCINSIERLQKISQPIRILDIGTGTGCIAISLAKSLPHAQVFATDISEIALDLARKNATINNVTNITFLLSDLFNSIPQTMRFDIIISNPPYISVADWKKLDPSVKDWEDNNALIAPENGIAILKKIINNSPSFLKTHTQLAHENIPNLMVEIGYTQGDEVRTLFLERGFKNVKIKKDLHGNDRLVQGYINVEKRETS